MLSVVFRVDLPKLEKNIFPAIQTVLVLFAPVLRCFKDFCLHFNTMEMNGISFLVEIFKSTTFLTVLKQTLDPMCTNAFSKKK